MPNRRITDEKIMDIIRRKAYEYVESYLNLLTDSIQGDIYEDLDYYFESFIAPVIFQTFHQELFKDKMYVVEIKKAKRMFFRYFDGFIYLKAVEKMKTLLSQGWKSVGIMYSVHTQYMRTQYNENLLGTVSPFAFIYSDRVLKDEDVYDLVDLAQNRKGEIFASDWYVAINEHNYLNTLREPEIALLLLMSEKKYKDDNESVYDMILEEKNGKLDTIHNVYS